MPDRFRKYHAKDGFVAFGPVSGTLDYLFLWKGDPGADTIADLPTLLQQWEKAQVSAEGLSLRAILFCQLFDPATIAASLDTFLASGDLGDHLGKLVHWAETSFTGTAVSATFPNSSNTPITIGAIALTLDVGDVPATLDDFTFAVDASQANLELTLKTLPAAEWSIDGAAAGSVLTVVFDPGADASGSLGVSIPWTDTPDAPHPVNRAQMAFVGSAKPLPQAGDDPAPSRVWAAKIADKISNPTGGSIVLLDPRDKLQLGWFKGGANSRILFGNAEIHSSLFSAPGDRFILQAREDAAVRLGFLYDTMNDDLSLSSSGEVLFHPEGNFDILGPVAPATARDTAAAADDLNVGSFDLLAGATSTEFIDLSAASHIEFVKSQPAFFLENQSIPNSSATETVLDSQKSLVVTSHVQFHAKDGGLIPYHSQGGETPLFEDAGGNHLRRYRKPVGQFQLGKPLPLFPRAGHQAGPFDADLLSFEATALAKYRRNQSTPMPAPAAPEARDPAATRQLVVTPQGLLADVNESGYKTLYFGNPAGDAVSLEFSLEISNNDATLYAELQKTLSSNQLFMVFRNPSVGALSTANPSVTINARGFTFNAGAVVAAGTPSTTSVSLGASAIIIKFFGGKSMEKLVTDTTLWGCQNELAPAGITDIDKWNPFHDGTVPDHLQDLHRIWTDPNWQGVLLLDLPVAEMPPLLEALRPGLNSPGPGLPPELRAPYLGLNTVPTKKQDLTGVGGNPPSVPNRAGSLFGLVYYEQGKQAPTPPETGDKEPGLGDDSNNVRKYAFIVDFLQIGFQNSQISTFQAKVHIQFTHLFWDVLGPATAPPTSLELDGQYESRPTPGGGSEDVFSLVSPGVSTIEFPSTSYLQKFTLTRAQLNVVSEERNTDANKSLKTLTAFIGFDGTAEFSEKLTFPLFTVKSIRLSNFGFGFTYKYQPSNFSFGFKADGISADIAFDGGAANSLLSMLPLRLKGMAIAIADLIDLESDLHFQPLQFGGIGTKLHFGFLMELDLGSIGKLAEDLSGLRVPLMLGWRGGSSPGLALGIQFPTFNGRIDIGIQQFIRLQADHLILKQCMNGNALQALAIQAVNARVVMLGKEWPEQDLAFVIFVPQTSNRKMSWALSLKSSNGNWYVGGGYRITFPGIDVQDVEALIANFQGQLTAIDDKSDVCTLLGKASPERERWALAAKYASDSFEAAIAISDDDLYGLDLVVSGLRLSLIYRRVNGQLGIFSLEICLPGAIRNMQFGAVSVRLPVFRVEVHTDGGFLADFGFPWNLDFSRSAQVEFAIFLGSGGFYFGKTSSAAVDVLHFPGGYGFLALDQSDADTVLQNTIRVVRLGFAARVGIGRSFAIGILTAEASLTVFGGLEGAAGYLPGHDLFSPTIYALTGYMGLMLDIHATVSFAIIQASAWLTAYAEVGLVISRVVGKQNGVYYQLTLPVVIFAQVGLSVGVDVRIKIGCVHITIHLCFNTTWRYEEQISSFGSQKLDYALAAPRDLTKDTENLLALAVPRDLPPVFRWNANYRYWTAQHSLTIYGTVLPCLATATDVNDTGDLKVCVVGTMLLPVRSADPAFADLTRFLVGWVLLPSASVTGNPADYDGLIIDLGTLQLRHDQLQDEAIWKPFADLVMPLLGNQFAPSLKALADGQDEPFAVIPPWPGSVFSYLPGGGAGVVSRISADVMVNGKSTSVAYAVFAEYCRHLIASTLPELLLLVKAKGTVKDDPGPLQLNDLRKSMTWSEIWTEMFNPPA